MTNLILALTIFLMGVFAAHDVFAQTPSSFGGYYQSRDTGCVLRVHYGYNVTGGGSWAMIQGESNSEQFKPCKLTVSEGSACTERGRAAFCQLDSNSTKRGHILLKADGTMVRDSDIRFSGTFDKIANNPTPAGGKQ